MSFWLIISDVPVGTLISNFLVLHHAVPLYNEKSSKYSAYSSILLILAEFEYDECSTLYVPLYSNYHHYVPVVSNQREQALVLQQFHKCDLMLYYKN